MTVAHHVVRRALDILCERLTGGSFAVTVEPGLRFPVRDSARACALGGAWLLPPGGRDGASCARYSFPMELIMECMSIPIGGMSCGGCVSTVRNAFAAIPGVEVQQVKVGLATVACDPAVVELGARSGRRSHRRSTSRLRPSPNAELSPVTQP